MNSQEEGTAGLVVNAEPPAREKTRVIVDKDDTTSPPKTSEPVSEGHVNVAFSKDNNNPVTKQPEASHNGSTPVYYTSGGGAKIDQSRVIVTRPDGTRYVRTPQPVSLPMPTRVLKEKDLKCICVFSIIATLCFFPTGIPAIFCGWRTRQEYYKGMESNNLDEAKRYAKKSERMIVISIVLGLIALAIAIAAIEHAVYKHDAEYWEKRYPHTPHHAP